MPQLNGFNMTAFKAENANSAIANQFRVEIFAPNALRNFIPDVGDVERSLPYKIKTSVIPSFTLEQREITFRGKRCILPADRPAYEPWTVTVYATQGMPERHFFESWQDSINGIKEGDRVPEADSDFMSDSRVELLDQNGAPHATYVVGGIWPLELSQVSLDWESGETLVFDVTFAVNDLESVATRLNNILT